MSSVHRGIRTGCQGTPDLSPSVGGYPHPLAMSGVLSRLASGCFAFALVLGVFNPGVGLRWFRLGCQLKQAYRTTASMSTPCPNFFWTCGSELWLGQNGRYPSPTEEHQAPKSLWGPHLHLGCSMCQKTASWEACSGVIERSTAFGIAESSKAPTEACER